MTITEIYIDYTQYKLYISYTSHTILSSHYSLQRLVLWDVDMTLDSVSHFSHYISRGTQLEELVLSGVKDSDDDDDGRYVHN